MNPRRVLVALMLALAISGLATWLISRRLATPTQIPKTPATMYAAPAHPLQAGELLKSDSMEMVAWPATVPLDGAFSRPEDAVGREVLFPLEKGQPVLERDLSAPGAGTGLASRIPDGMRAVALRSDEVVGVAGFLVPGSHLDVLVTYRLDSSPDFLTATVLQNVVVLAAGHQLEPDPAGKTSDVTIVTLLLNPEQAQRAVLASAQGSIHFVLRNGEDSNLTHQAPVLISQLAGHTIAPQHAVPVGTTSPAAATPRHREIETVLGGVGESQPAGAQGGGSGQ